MTQIFGKWPKYLGIAQIHRTSLQYLRRGFTMLEMAEEFDKWFKSVGNDVYIWEMAQVVDKRLNYVGNHVDLWEMTQICILCILETALLCSK